MKIYLAGGERQKEFFIEKRNISNLMERKFLKNKFNEFEFGSLSYEDNLDGAVVR